MNKTTTDSMAPCALRPATPADAAQLTGIYNPYVLTTPISFEESAIGADEMAARIAKSAAAGLPWLVAEHAGHVVGYAYASPWRERAAYRFAVECTVYTAPARQRRGIGSALYRALFERLAQGPWHTVIAGIALPNAASVALHEKMGLRKVAHLSEVGFKFGRWHDVGYWQRLL
jgi:phosphinothricin acetyltransferase